MAKYNEDIKEAIRLFLFGWCNGIIKLVHSLLAAKKLDESIY